MTILSDAVILEKIETIHKLLKNHVQNNKEDFNEIKDHLKKLNGRTGKTEVNLAKTDTKVNIYIIVGGSIIATITSIIILILKSYPL